MLKLKNLLLLPLIYVSINCVSMEKPITSSPQKSTTTSRAIFSHDENIFKNLETDISQAKFISFDALVFTNQTLGDALKKSKR